MNLVIFYSLLLVNVIEPSRNLNGEGKVCGRPVGGSTIEEKIVGGYDIGYYKYSWYAALMVENIVACGGALVGAQTVISAAHCFRELITSNSLKKIKLEDAYNVTLGMFNRCEKEKTQKKFFVKKVYVHEKYKDNIPYYDISLLILKESTSSFEPICLPKGVIKVRPREGTVPGMGTLRYQGATPCTLHEARLLIYSDLECQKMLNRTGNDPKKLYKAFCAGYIQGGIDTCQGDSGGPFQITDDYGNIILLGLVSFGFHCANPNLLGIYTDASQYIDWIEEKAGFNATMGETENATQIHYTISEPTTKIPKTKKPNYSHTVRPAIVRPINIIIVKDKKQEKSVLESSKNGRKRTISKKKKLKQMWNKMLQNACLND